MYRMNVLGAGAFGSDLTRDLKSQCSHLDGNFRTRRMKWNEIKATAREQCPLAPQSMDTDGMIRIINLQLLNL